jgi:hypothetical protein
MVIAVCDCVRCALYGVRLSGIQIHAVCGSVRQSARLYPAVRQCEAVCALVCGSAGAHAVVCGCPALRQCAAVRQ